MLSSLPSGLMDGNPGVPQEVDLEQLWLGTALGISALMIAACGVIAHYRRERRRADLLRNLDHHEWCHWTRTRD